MSPAFLHKWITDEDEEGEGQGDEGDEGDDKEGCDTLADQGDHSKRRSTEVSPDANRGSSFLFSKY